MVTDEMVEKAAQGMAVADGHNPDNLLHNSLEGWRHYTPMARAALESVFSVEKPETKRPTAILQSCNFDGKKIPSMQAGWHPSSFDWSTIAVHEERDISITNVDFGKLYAALSAGEPIATVAEMGVGGMRVLMPHPPGSADHLPIGTKLYAAPRAPSVAIYDGRPCAMDAFASALQDDCDDPFDRWEAIVKWLHGDWDAALSYLDDETRARIAPAKQEGGTNE